MNESLSQMVKDTPSDADTVMFSEANIDLPETEETTSSETVEEVQTTPQIHLTSLFDWFAENKERFDNINEVKMQIRGVDSSKTLIMAVKDISGEQDVEGHDKRNLRVFENADSRSILTLPGISMDVFNNGFRVIHQYNDELFIKCYGTRTSLTAVFCNNINGQLIPYTIKKIKKKDTEIELQENSVAEVEAKLQEAADLEAVQLLYKQSAKAFAEITSETKQFVVAWMLDRQAEVTDINHHLQIDNVLINILQ